MSDKSAGERKPYIYPHRHCIYCGKMIEGKNRNYCLKCKPEYRKEVSKTERFQKFQKLLKYYIIILVVILAIVFLYSIFK